MSSRKRVNQNPGYQPRSIYDPDTGHCREAPRCLRFDPENPRRICAKPEKLKKTVAQLCIKVSEDSGIHDYADMGGPLELEDEMEPEMAYEEL